YKMTDSGDAASVPGFSGPSSGAGLGRGLAGRVRTLTSPTPPGRLTSLRTRDLTLGGGFKKTKKTFEPNVHAVRKSKDELKEEVHMAPKKERRDRNERRRENRGRRKERPQTIQSHSIFEQGPADSVRKTGAQPQPSFFIDDPGLRNDAKLKPIQLPLCQSTMSHTLTSTTCEKTTTANPSPFRPQSCGAQDRAGNSRTEPPKPEQPSLVELLRDLSLSGREELFFMQLPDCMPCRASGLKVNPAPGPTAETPAKKEEKPEEKRTSHFQAQNSVKEGCPVLSQFPEGFLGKLQIRKSGKVELKLGDIIMDVSEGAAFSFLQQLVSVRLCDGRTGDMMVLGNVHHKLVLSPDFQALLSQAASQQPQGP
uniref:Zgc:171971 n=1 Tax=Amphilophus citrinellus TaxID=61819 RepID=A0A3Q0R405_AMPCI